MNSSVSMRPALLVFLAVFALACEDLESLPAASGGQGGQSSGGQGGVSGAGQAGAGQAGAGQAGAGQGGAGQAGSGGVTGGSGGAKGGQAGSAGSAGLPSGVRVPDCDAPTVSPSGGSCITVDEFVTCNPVSNAPCKDGETCDFAGAGSTKCFPPPNESNLCEPCNNDVGPFCVGGQICVDNVCHKFCCDDADCGPGALCTGSPLAASKQESGGKVCVRFEDGAAGKGGSGGASGAGGASGEAGAGGAAGKGGSAPFSIGPACEKCFGNNCGAQFGACQKNPDCVSCATKDPFQDKCKTNSAWQDILTCLCTESTCAQGDCSNECAVLKP